MFLDCGQMNFGTISLLPSKLFQFYSHQNYLNPYLQSYTVESCPNPNLQSYSHGICLNVKLSYHHQNVLNLNWQSQSHQNDIVQYLKSCSHQIVSILLSNPPIILPTPSISSGLAEYYPSTNLISSKLIQFHQYFLNLIHNFNLNISASTFSFSFSCLRSFARASSFFLRTCILVMHFFAFPDFQIMMMHFNPAPVPFFSESATPYAFVLLQSC